MAFYQGRLTTLDHSRNGDASLPDHLGPEIFDHHDERRLERAQGLEEVIVVGSTGYEQSPDYFTLEQA